MTGARRGVTALAGDMLSNSGRHHVVVAIVNRDKAGAARPALDAQMPRTLRDAAAF